MKKDDTVYLRHILDAIEKIEGYWEIVQNDLSPLTQQVGRIIEEMDEKHSEE